MSLALPLRTTGLYTSLAKALALARSWLSAVDMLAARMAESRMPEMSAGNSLRTIWMKTVELSESSPSSRWPEMPAMTEKTRMSTVQVMPMRALFFRSLSERTDMKRMMMCGMPK